ncbi:MULTISPECIES: TfoX/Sxy family protein [Amycolatopsis]|uniref:TfoX/Sxy family protein n=1 Tax=Amycolatopsis thermalba TaxID=944492 RepID=A0ABY4NYH1_9PSEU|nr:MULTISPECIES: TfoX/Sxy family protein [Amycolatopsis]OXM75350.1 RNA methyltransferase [Amycolatopsis sp. KNN50.9b]UQS25125.1 TfoX/Sxy family protein [Amycolatopsis thermalba]
MAYDHELADRVRDLLSGADGMSEKRMFGGLGFLVHGNMALAAASGGGLLVRVEPDDGERLLGGDVQPMVMRGREMRGWLRVGPAAVRTPEQLGEWVERGVSYARALPAKA